MFERCNSCARRLSVEDPYKSCGACRESTHRRRRRRLSAGRCAACGVGPLVTQTLCAACRRDMQERNRRRRGLPPLPTLAAEQKA